MLDRGVQWKVASAASNQSIGVGVQSIQVLCIHRFHRSNESIQVTHVSDRPTWQSVLGMASSSRSPTLGGAMGWS